MALLRTLVFDTPGKANTQATLEAAAARMEQLGIRDVVVATTTGYTALELARRLQGKECNIVGVTLQAGLWEKYAPPDGRLVAEAEALGVRFYTGTHVLMGGLDTAVREKFGGLGEAELIAHTLYAFSQGTKVAVEVLLGACDAGLIPAGAQVVAIAGTEEGCDTALVCTSATSHRFFDLRVHEIVAKPR